MEAAPKSFWPDSGTVEPDPATHRVSTFDDLGWRDWADLIRIFTRAGIPLPIADQMQTWELAAAVGADLGPTIDEQKLADIAEAEKDTLAERQRRVAEVQARRAGKGLPSSSMRPADGA